MNSSGESETAEPSASAGRADMLTKNATIHPSKTSRMQRRTRPTIVTPTCPQTQNAPKWIDGLAKAP
jgi:hypothetical protein